MNEQIIITESGEKRSRDNNIYPELLRMIYWWCAVWKSTASLHPTAICEMSYFSLLRRRKRFSLLQNVGGFFSQFRENEESHIMCSTYKNLDSFRYSEEVILLNWLVVFNVKYVRISILLSGNDGWNENLKQFSIVSLDRWPEKGKVLESVVTLKSTSS